MAQDDFTPKLGRIRDSTRVRQPSFKQQVLKQAGKSDLRATWYSGHATERQSGVWQLDARQGGDGHDRAESRNVDPGSRPWAAVA